MFQTRRLYKTLRTFFDETYLHSYNASDQFNTIEENHVQRFIKSQEFRIEYKEIDGIYVYEFFKCNHCDIDPIANKATPFYTIDCFNAFYLCSKLKFIDLEVTNIRAISVLLTFYHDHYHNNFERNIRQF